MDKPMQHLSDFFQAIRDRPAMYLTPVSICALYHFISGYGSGQKSASTVAKSPFDLPLDFHDWVAYRLHFHEATSGWHNMIVERLGDGPHAVDRFFMLVDDYWNRTPRVVATLSGLDRTYTEWSAQGESTRSVPPNLSLVSYNTEDPGLFVSAEDADRFPGEGFCPNLRYFEFWFGPCRSKLTVLDVDAYDRWANQGPPSS